MELLKYIRENNFVLRHTREGKKWYKAGSYNPLTGTKLYTDEELIKLFENDNNKIIS